jgi:hypothetical protein
MFDLANEEYRAMRVASLSRSIDRSGFDAHRALALAIDLGLNVQQAVRAALFWGSIASSRGTRTG